MKSNSRPISWHEECLINRRKSLLAELSQIESLINTTSLSYKQAKFLERQIEEAKRQGKSEFDSDRFLSKEWENLVSIEPFQIITNNGWISVKERLPKSSTPEDAIRVR
jgi:hypothetical protein